MNRKEEFELQNQVGTETQYSGRYLSQIYIN